MMPIPYKLRLFTLRHRVNLAQWLGLLAAIAVLAVVAWLTTWGIITVANLYHERNELRAEAEIGKLSYREESWKKKEREAYIAEARKTNWKRKILEAK